MNKKILLVLLVCPTLVFAEYSVLIPTTNKIDIKYTGGWEPISPLYGSWINTGSPYDCKTWTPIPDAIAKGTEFTQTSLDCTQAQTRTVTQQERNKYTQAVRNGSVSNEAQIIYTGINQRKSLGTKTTICSYDSNNYVYKRTRYEFRYQGIMVGSNSSSEFRDSNFRYYAGQIVYAASNEYSSYFQICVEKL